MKITIEEQARHAAVLTPDGALPCSMPEQIIAERTEALAARLSQLVVTGELGNALPGWGLLGAPVRATVLDPEHTPTCTSSDDEQLSAVLDREWPHDEVLAAFD